MPSGILRRGFTGHNHSSGAHGGQKGNPPPFRNQFAPLHNFFAQCTFLPYPGDPGQQTRIF